MPASSLTPLKRQLARRIEACVGDLNLRQVEAAEMLGLTQPRLNALLKGRVELFSLDALAQIAMRAGLTVRVSATRSYRQG
ncbi:MAG: transcriptional regulator [Betaproteobacteria bacterium]|nr:MAG: transcriptional regulator [Betaproteobacteria bacterium]